MLRISWTDSVSYLEVLHRAKSEHELIITIKCRKISYLDHFLQGDKYQLLQLIMKGKIEDKKMMEMMKMLAGDMYHGFITLGS